MVTPNQFGNPRKEIYIHLIQDWLPWDQKDARKGEREFLTGHYRPRICTEEKTGRYSC